MRYIAMFFIVLSGCYHGKIGRDFDVKVTTSFTPGQTTQEEVKKVLGEPQYISVMEGGCELWGYWYMRSRGMVVPLIMVTGSNMNTQIKTMNLVFKDGLFLRVAEAIPIAGTARQ